MIEDMSNESGGKSKMYLTAVGTSLALVAAVVAALSTMYVPRSEADERHTELVEHVAEFRGHTNLLHHKGAAPREMVDEMRADAKEQRALIQNVRENLIRLMERQRVPSSPMTP